MSLASPPHSLSVVTFIVWPSGLPLLQKKKKTNPELFLSFSFLFTPYRTYDTCAYHTDSLCVSDKVSSSRKGFGHLWIIITLFQVTPDASFLLRLTRMAAPPLQLALYTSSTCCDYRCVRSVFWTTCTGNSGNCSPEA